MYPMGGDRKGSASDLAAEQSRSSRSNDSGEAQMEVEDGYDGSIMDRE